MSDMTTTPSARSIRFSILHKCLLILVATTFSVASVLVFKAERTTSQVSHEGAVVLARDVTELTATQLAGAVRFGKIDIVQETIDALHEKHRDIIHSITVINAETQTIASSGSMVPGDLMDLARVAQVSASITTTGDDLWISVPIGENGATGALAIAWTDAASMAALREARASNLMVAGAVFVAALLASALFFRVSLARPVAAVANRTAAMSKGDLESVVQHKERSDEIGLMARELDALRDQLAEAKAVTEDALFQSAGFQGSSAALTMTDNDLRLTHFNQAFSSLIDTMGDHLLADEELQLSDLIGQTFTDALKEKATIDAMIAPRNFPALRDLRVGEWIVSLKINQVLDTDQNKIGYIFEWEDITISGTNGAVLAALEADQLRVDFDAKGTLKSVNRNMARVFPDLGSPSMSDLLVPRGEGMSLEAVAAGGSVFGKFDLGDKGTSRVVNGGMTPILDRDGRPTGFTFLGQDVTASENAQTAAQETAMQLEKAQRFVVDSLSGALTALSQGDLSVRLETTFAEDYEALRGHFNASVAALDEAVTMVLENSGAILSESGNISSAADDLSRRTEQQAATLEEFAAALTEITASVASAADGASQASNVVTDARKNAEASGTVVREAVDAMGEIANSSEQISRIISVIDDIAFQTNLLALNAGVEAARAGDAGRGFAVVASEVRALAQRSSEAAREINTLISTSGSQVKRGVSLVDKAGDALNEIVTSVGDIEDHVTGIASSAREQSTGLEEINTAISQLDQVTQQNVAMFEETTAATHTLTAEANALVTTTGRFKTSQAVPAVARHTETPSATNSATTSPPPPATPPRDAGAPTPVPFSSQSRVSPSSDGNLALADEDDWEDF